MILLLIYLIFNSFITGYMYRDQYRLQKGFAKWVQLVILFLFGIFIMGYAILTKKK